MNHPLLPREIVGRNADIRIQGMNGPMCHWHSKIFVPRRHILQPALVSRAPACYHWLLGTFLRTVLTRPGYRAWAIPSNYTATAVVTGAVFSSTSQPLLPFASKAAPILTVFWVTAALVQVQTLAVSAFTMCGHSADKPVAPALTLSSLRTLRPVFQTLSSVNGQC